MRRRRLLPVALFTAAYSAVALAGAIRARNAEFLFYLAVLAILVSVVAIVDRRVGLSRAALWGLSLWGLAHMVGGLVPLPVGWPSAPAENAVVYNAWLVPERIKYDHVVHAWGFGVTTWVCWQGLVAAFRRRGVAVEPTGGLLLLAAAAGLGFGALNELIEFAATLLVPETNVGGYLNTGWDLTSNLVGVVIAVTAIAIGGGGRPGRSKARRPRSPEGPSSGLPPVHL